MKFGAVASENNSPLAGTFLAFMLTEIACPGLLGTVPVILVNPL